MIWAGTSMGYAALYVFLESCLAFGSEIRGTVSQQAYHRFTTISYRYYNIVYSQSLSSAGVRVSECVIVDDKGSALKIWGLIPPMHYDAIIGVETSDPLH
jgi:hypothetical protein